MSGQKPGHYRRGLGQASVLSRLPGLNQLAGLGVLPRLGLPRAGRAATIARFTRRRLALAGGPALVLGLLLAPPAAAATAGSAALAVAAGPAVRTASLYATPSGHGTACSKRKPCAAATAVKKADSDSAFIGERVAVHLARGIYHTTLNANFLPPSDADSITVSGAGAGTTVIDAGHKGAALTLGVDTPTMIVTHLGLRDGVAPTSAPIGGGVAVGGGDITIADSVISASKATAGAGIGIAGGELTLESSTISGNVASDSGGAISEVGGSVTVIGSTLSGNKVSSGTGGGISVDDARLTITDSTIAGNSASGTAPVTGEGGAIALNATDGPVSAVITGSTLSGNRASQSGGAIWSHGSSTSIGADILASDTAPGGPECSGGAFHGLGYNVSDDSSCPLGSHGKVAPAPAIGLHPLAGNGGGTDTERITSSSAAHGVVGTAAVLDRRVFCAGTDQRGVPRRQGPARHCDAGAYQVAPPHITKISPASGVRGIKVTISGYGLDFVRLRFGAARPGSSASHGFTRLTFRVPSVSPGKVTLTLTNADGSASARFTVQKKKKKG